MLHLVNLFIFFRAMFKTTFAKKKTHLLLFFSLYFSFSSGEIWGGGFEQKLITFFNVFLESITSKEIQFLFSRIVNFF